MRTAKLGFLFAAFQAICALDSLPAADAGASSLSDTNATAEFKAIEGVDDAAQAEVDQWVRDNTELRAKGRGVAETELERRITEGFAPVHKAYDEFVRHHPKDA